MEASALIAPPFPNAMEKFPRLRQSLLASFDRCSLSTRFEIEHSQDWSTHDQARGQLFHRIAAKSLEAMSQMQEDRIPVSEALAIFEEVLRQHDVDDECPRCLSEAPPEFIGEGMFRCTDPECGKEFPTRVVSIPVEQVADLRMSVIKWANDNQFDIANLADIEQRLRVGIFYDGGAYGQVQRILSGQLDALFFEGDRAIVLDWKDTWALPPESGVSFTGYFQQRFYAYLVLMAYPAVQSVTLREFYVRRSESREATIGRGDLDDIRVELSALVERFDRAYEKSLWRPSPGKHCSYCPLPERCTIFKGARGEGFIENEDDARRAAAEVLVAEALRDKRLKAMKAWSDRKGNVPIPVADAKGRTHFGYQPTETTLKPDKAMLEAELRRAGAEGVVDIEKLYRKRTGTKFGAHTPQDAASQVTPEDARMAEQMRASLDAIKARNESA